MLVDAFDADRSCFAGAELLLELRFGESCCQALENLLRHGFRSVGDDLDGTEVVCFGDM